MGSKVAQKLPKIKKKVPPEKFKTRSVININHLVHKPALNNMLLSCDHKIKHHRPLRTYAYDTHVQPRVGFLIVLIIIIIN